jgi:hypothetical protein
MRRKIGTKIGTFVRNVHSGSRTTYSLAMHVLHERPGYQIATEGALIGSIIEHGISKHLVIVSDDAGQFNVLLHAL